ncbi:MAG: RNA polymerase sigma factor [Isosphaeraceae bacterium]
MSSVEPTDDSLAARVKAGDAEAFAILVERHRAGLVRLASLLIGDLDEAESIAQEAMTRALTGIAGYDPQTPFLAWIRGIVLNLARQHQRRLRRHAVVTDPSLLASAPGEQGRRQGVLSAILRDELASRLWLAVGQLPESYREAVVLHYVEGMDYSQISQITGVSAGALRVRALRGRNLLRGQLGPVVDTWLNATPEIEDKL